MLDARARIAYDALKRWHTAHMAFYDKAIDPLTSPKALDKLEMADFYAEYLKIRKLDLNVMRDVINLIQKNADTTIVMNFIEKAIAKNRSFFAMQEQKINDLYSKSKLHYSASVNPFIKVK